MMSLDLGMDGSFRPKEHPKLTILCTWAHDAQNIKMHHSIVVCLSVAACVCHYVY